MKTRIISGIVIGIILVLTLSSGGYILGGFLLAVSEVAYFELARTLGFSENGKTSLLQIVGHISVALHYLLLMTYHDVKVFLCSILFAFFGIMIVYVLTFPRYKSVQAIEAVFSFMYAPVLLSFIYMLRIMPNGYMLVWIPFVAFVCDTFAYFTGKAFGKHKMCPILSPKKTVEGAIGGVFFSVLAGVIFAYVLQKNSGVEVNVTIQYMIITFVASIISQIGDLAASAIKRDKKIKDYGNLIPGHGGIMDRFDSVTFVAPLIYVLEVLFSIIGA